MDPEQNIEESIDTVARDLPPQIRNFIASGKARDATRRIMARYQLHVDQAGILSREILLLLIGLKNPDEFVQSLSGEAGLDEKVIGDILQDINVQIFAPLREEERRGGPTPTQPPRPPVQMQKPSAPKPTFAQVPSYAPPKQVPVQNKPMSAVPPPVFEKIPTPSTSGVRPPQQFQPPRPQIPNTPPRPMVAAPKSVAPNRTLEDHEEPHIEFSKQPAPARPVQVAAPAAGMPARTAPPPPNLPGAMPQTPQQPQRPGVIPPGGRPVFVMPHMPDAPARPAPTPRPVPPPPPPPQKTPMPPAPKSYGADPYREPIDE